MESPAVQSLFLNLPLDTLAEAQTLKIALNEIIKNNLEPYVSLSELKDLKDRVVNLSKKKDELQDVLLECLEGIDKLDVELVNCLIYNSTNYQATKWKFKKYEKLITSLQVFLQQLDGEAIDVLRKTLELPENYQIMLHENNIERFTVENLDAIRKIYLEQFIKGLRNRLINDKTDKQLLELCYQLFTNISMDDENHNILDLFNNWGKHVTSINKEKYTVWDLLNIWGNDQAINYKHPEVNEIACFYHNITAVPNSAKTPIASRVGLSALGYFNRGFDPMQSGNPPHYLFEFQINQKLVKSLAFGSPTDEGVTFYNSAILTSEFSAFLHACKAKGKKYLYIINQDFTANGYVKAERPRCKLLLDIQEEEELKDTFFAMAFTRDSKFYKQEGMNYTSWDTFQKDLIAQFYMPDSGCVIPKDILITIHDDLKLITNAIHNILFKNKDPELRLNRLIFIDLFFDELTKCLLVILEIDFFSIICKDDIDRGAMAIAKLYANVAIINKMFDVARLRRTMVLMMVRALHVRKRAPDLHRVERFLQSLDFCLSHIPELIELHNFLLEKILKGRGVSDVVKFTLAEDF